MRKCLLILATCALATTLARAQSPIEIQVNAQEAGARFRPVWAWVGHDEPNFTYTPQGRQLLAKLARLAPGNFHDRTHNLLTSGNGQPALKWGSTNVLTLDSAGKPVYNWTILDLIFDTYRDTGITPYVELGFMPKALSIHPEPYRHHWPHGPLFTGWSYPPQNYEMWSELIYHLVEHMAKRYGRATVAKWEWEVWNEPDIPYWHGSFDQYCKLYDYTAAGVKRALPDARVGGPATTSPANPRAARYLRDFLTHCEKGKNYANGKTGAPLDFISFHAKGHTTFDDGSVEMDIGRQLRDIESGFAVIESFPKFRRLPVVISESDPETCAACAADLHPEMGYRYTSQYASYEAELLSRTLALARRHRINLQGAVSWAFTFPGQPIFAGYRAFTTDGIDLPLFNGFRLFGKLRGRRVAVESSGALKLNQVLTSSIRSAPDVNAMATREKNQVDVLVWNYSDKAASTAALPVELKVNGLPKNIRNVRLVHFQVDDQHGDAYPVWRAMGSPANPTPPQMQKLKAAAQMQTLGPAKQIPVSGGALIVTLTEPPEGLSLLEFSW